MVEVGVFAREEEDPCIPRLKHTGSMARTHHCKGSDSIETYSKNAVTYNTFASVYDVEETYINR